MSRITINGTDVLTGLGSDITIAGILIGFFLLGVILGRKN